MSKIKDFKMAMDQYNDHAIYRQTSLLMSSMIVFMQALCVFHLIQSFNGNSFSVLILIVAYILTDFINGLIHMYMDNNTHYRSLVGPFIAAFHLHHKQPMYKKRNPLLIYFFESGSKFWLVVYLALLVYAQYELRVPFNLNLFLTAIGIFSSFAEVSHYWCHNAHKSNVIIYKLQQLRILLPKDHHKYHHMSDNTHYAFLNGVTDPLINLIARHMYSGYKNNADLHVLAYKGKGTNNRD